MRARVAALEAERDRLKGCVEDFLEMNPTMRDAAYEAEHSEPAVVHAVPTAVAERACDLSSIVGSALARDIEDEDTPLEEMIAKAVRATSGCQSIPERFEIYKAALARAVAEADATESANADH